MTKRSQIPKRVRETVLSECRMVCPICEEPLILDLHHIIYYSLGGNNNESNFIPLCPRCHRAVHIQKISPTILRRVKSLWATFGYSGKKVMKWIRYCQRILAESEKDPVLSQYYVELNGAIVNDALAGTLKDYVTTWLQTGTACLLAVLGDYGTGKTMFLRSLQADLARKWLLDQTSILPILVQLRNYSRHRSIVDVLSDHLQEFGLRYDDLFSFPDRQPVAFLLDGLDEMSEYTRKELRSYRFFQLSRISSALSRLIITSRTNFFRDLQDEQKHLALLDSSETGLVLYPQHPDIVYVLPFQQAQISFYLKRRFPSYADVHSRLKKLYDFWDLARRPILLDLLATAAADKELSIILDKPSDVYDLIVDRWVSRDYWRSINPNDLRTLMSHLALQIFVNRKTDLRISEIEANVAKFLKEKVLSIVDLDHFTENICISGFVFRDAEGNWSFNHRSFYEYFLAWSLAGFISDSLTRKSRRYILTSKRHYIQITSECFHFLSGFLESSFKVHITKFSKVCKRLVKKVLLLCDDEDIMDIYEELIAGHGFIVVRKFEDGLSALLYTYTWRPDAIALYGSDQKTLSGKHFVMLYRGLLKGKAPILYWASRMDLYDDVWQRQYKVEYYPSPAPINETLHKFMNRVAPRLSGKDCHKALIQWARLSGKDI